MVGFVCVLFCMVLGVLWGGGGGGGGCEGRQRFEICDLRFEEGEGGGADDQVSM